MDNLRVLIVDDDTALLQALPQAIALRMQQVQVDTSDSALGALRLVQKYEYDAIVSDIKMPGMDGITLIEQLQVRCPDIPTLLITGHGERDLAIQALRVGAYDFIQKPIDRDYFITSLKRAVQTRQMRRQIAEQQQELENYTHQLEQTVTERTRELVEANATKDVFMSMVSHELKTPLTTLKGISQMVYRRVERGEQVELKNLALLESSVRRMELLVNDLLNTSLIETGMFSLHRQPCDLVAACQQLLAEYRASMGESLHVEIQARTLEIDMDSERIGQVVLNLLSNARKYAPKDSCITVKIERQRDEAAISIEDRGVGIPPEKLAHIFERFYRVPEIDVQTGSSAGVGLGLYIAQKIIEQHGGRISASSVPGEGSTFTIYLPLLPENESQPESTRPHADLAKQTGSSDT
ncbi:MAG: hybrid sensor histidine kinase/response regulator [Ktedonobacteraceae bacterium]